MKMSNTTDDSLPKFKCACYPHFSCNADSDFCLTDTTVSHVVVLLLTSLSSGLGLAMVTVVFFFVFFFPQFCLTTLSINSVHLLRAFAVVLHSPPTLSRSLLTQSSLRILSFPRLPCKPAPSPVVSLLVSVHSNNNNNNNVVLNTTAI